MTPEQAEAVAQQQVANAQQQAFLDSGVFAGQEADIQNSRQFYLEYDVLIDEMMHYWKGEEKGDDGVWSRKEETLVLMNNEAARVLGGLLKTSLSKPVRLSNIPSEKVNEFAYKIREKVAGWLTTTGWIEYNIPVGYVPVIMNQCETLIYTSLLWGMNAGGQRFMTTSGRWVESNTQVVGGGQSRAGSPGAAQGDVKRSFNFFKPFGR